MIALAARFEATSKGDRKLRAYWTALASAGAGAEPRGHVALSSLLAAAAAGLA
jgi:hypothetical protein